MYLTRFMYKILHPRRRDQHSGATPDKIVLRSGAGKGGSFLLADLYASQIPVPPHAHENQHGQVTWLEWAGEPLVSSLGYDNVRCRAL